MSAFPNEPKPGEKISATLIRDIIRCLRRKSLLQGPGYLVRETPHGTHLSMTAAGRGKAVEAEDLGCWKIVSGPDPEEQQGEGEEQQGEGEGPVERVHYFENRYYRVGGFLHECQSLQTIEGLLAAEKPFVACRIAYGGNRDPYAYSADVVGYGSFQDMKDEARNRNYTVIPLYKFVEWDLEDEDAPREVEVEVDFRNMPIAQEFEMPVEGGVA